MLSSMERRNRGGAVALLLAAAIPLAASVGTACGAVRRSRLTLAAKQHPNRKVEVIVQFRSGTSVRTARPRRFHHGRVTDGSRPSTASPSSSRPRGGGAPPTASGSSTSRSTRRVHSTGCRRRQARDDLPEDRRRRQAVGRAASPARASASPSSIPASAGNMPDFKGADGSSRIVANVVTSPGATRRATIRPRHARRRHHRRQLVQPRRRRPVLRRLRRHRSRGRPDRAQGRRRRRRRDDGRRHQRHCSTWSTTRPISASAS